MIRRPIYPPNEIALVMRSVLISLIPSVIALTTFFGAGVLFNLVTGIATALVSEAICLKLRQRPAMPRLTDLSAILTGSLIALALPQAAPWWLVIAASASSIILGKHIYGGLGQNPLNPAMLGYAIMIISAPVAMTTLWTNPLATPDLLNAWMSFLGYNSDATTAATTLGLYRTEFITMTAVEVMRHPLFQRAHLGLIYGYEWVALGYLAGGSWLIYQRIITWHTPVGFLATLVVISAFFSFDPDTTTPVWVHLIGGASIFSAFFILTDPVSGATSPKGRFLFAIGVGLLTYLIRTYGQYPDAIAFSVLLMNFVAPTIDHYTRPRVMGRKASIRGSGGGPL